jgi:hypothetical protein
MKEKGISEPPAEPDLSVALASADAFYDTWRRGFRGMLGRLPGAETQQMPEGLGGLVASATNLFFAIELYIKVLTIRTGKQPSHTHNLSELYSELPGQVRAEVERAYDTSLQAAPRGVPTAVRITRQEPGGTPPDGSEEPVHDLPSVLLRSAEGFDEWRYVYESWLSGGQATRFKTLEWGWLDLGCRALSWYVRKDEMNTRNETGGH